MRFLVDSAGDRARGSRFDAAPAVAKALAGLAEARLMLTRAEAEKIDPTLASRFAVALGDSYDSQSSCQ